MSIHIHINTKDRKAKDQKPEFSETILSLWKRYSDVVNRNLPGSVIQSLSRGAQSAESRAFNNLIREIGKQGLNVSQTLAQLNKYYHQ